MKTIVTLIFFKIWSHWVRGYLTGHCNHQTLAPPPLQKSICTDCPSVHTMTTFRGDSIYVSSRRRMPTFVENCFEKFSDSYMKVRFCHNPIYMNCTITLSCFSYKIAFKSKIPMQSYVGWVVMIYCLVRDCLKENKLFLSETLIINNCIWMWIMCSIEPVKDF